MGSSRIVFGSVVTTIIILIILLFIFNYLTAGQYVVQDNQIEQVSSSKSFYYL